MGCPEVQPHLRSCLNLPHAAQIEKTGFLCLLASLKDQSAAFVFVFARIPTFDSFVLLYTLVVHGLPFRSLDAFAVGLADGVPVLIHERWLPSFVFHMRGVNERAQCTFFICSPAPSRNTASGKSVVNIGFSTFFDSMFCPKSPISTAAWVVYRDELSEPVHYSEPTFLLQALYNHLDLGVAIFLLVCPRV